MGEGARVVEARFWPHDVTKIIRCADALAAAVDKWMESEQWEDRMYREPDAATAELYAMQDAVAAYQAARREGA